MTNTILSVQDYHLIKVGDWNVSPETCTVSREGAETKVTPRSMDVLRLLIEHAGKVVSSTEFLESVWRSPTATDHALHKAIAELRSALQDNAHRPQYIKTIPKRGYALIAPTAIEYQESTTPPTAPGIATIAAESPDTAETTNGTRPANAAQRREDRETLTLLGRLSFWRKLALASVLCALVIVTPMLFHSPEATPEAEGTIKLAVMPFASRAFSNENQILADGIRESLIHGLSKLGHLQVMSPARQPELVSVGLGDVSPRNYLREVDHVLQGSIMTSDGHLRVIVQLVRASDGLREYSDQFDLPMDNIFAVQDQIVTNVVSALSIYLNDQERAQMRDWGTTNPLAYERFLRGEFYNNQFNPADWERAMDYHRTAIELDPNFLNAYHGLATAANNLAVYSGQETIEKMYQVVLDLHRQISRIDPDSEILDSIHAIKLRMRGSNHIQQEMQLREQILSGDPPPFAMAHYALLLIGARMYDEAARFLQQASDAGPFEISPDEAWDYRNSILTPAEAVTARKDQLQQRPFHVTFLGSVAVNLAMLGDFRQAQIYLNQQRDVDTEGILAHYTEVVMGVLSGNIRRDDGSYEKALREQPDFYYNNGVLAFMLGDLETGVSYWQRLQPVHLRRMFNVTHAAEKFFPDHILHSEEYQQILNSLGAGIAWQRQLMEGVMAMEPVTGIGLHRRSREAYESHQMMMTNNYWSEQQWAEFEIHKAQRQNNGTTLQTVQAL